MLLVAPAEVRRPAIRYLSTFSTAYIWINDLFARYRFLSVTHEGDRFDMYKLWGKTPPE
jgi:hypothetical protein